MAKSKNAAKSALAALKGKSAAKPAPKKAAAKPVAKKPAAKAVVKKPAAKPAPAAKVVTKPAPKKPAAPPAPKFEPGPPKTEDVFSLVHRCWSLWSAGPVDMTADDVATHADAVGVVSVYGKGLGIPTAKAAAKLEAFRKLLAGEKDEPAPVVTSATAKPWEPYPESIARLLDGTSPEGNYGTWIVGGNLWEFEHGWAEPRRVERTEPEDWMEAGKVVRRDQKPEATLDEQLAAPPVEFPEPDQVPLPIKSEEAAEEEQNVAPGEPGYPEPFQTPGEVVCVPVEVPAAAEPEEPTGGDSPEL